MSGMADTCGMAWLTSVLGRAAVLPGLSAWLSSLGGSDWGCRGLSVFLPFLSEAVDTGTAVGAGWGPGDS